MSLQNQTEFVLFKIFVRISNLIGIRRARYAGIILAYVFFYIIPLRKKVVLSNLRKAFPEYSEKRISEIAFKSYRSFAITLFEILCVPKLSADKIRSFVKFSDLEFAKKCFEKQKGLIMLTAHYGNWELGAVAMGIFLNIPISVLVKQQRNQFVSGWLNSMRESFGNKVIPLGVSVKNVFRELQNKNIIGIVGDQRGPREGVRVKFFNQSTATYPGTAAMAFKTKSPVIVAMCMRHEDHTYEIVLKHIDVESYKGTEADNIIKFNQDYMLILEDFIRLYPEQWLWMHNIWKY